MRSFRWLRVKGTRRRCDDGTYC